MAGIVDIVRQAQGGAAIANLAQRFGLSPQQAEHAASVMLPELAKGFERNMLDTKGLSKVVDALATGNHAVYADDPSQHASTGAQTDGEEILGHLLGSKTGSRQLAAYGQQETGVPADVLKQMLPSLATLFMGAVSKQGSQALGQALGAVPGGIGGLEEILKRLPQGGAGGIDIGDILRRLPQAGGAGQGGSGGGQPGAGGLGDILGEIFKRLPQGGQKAPQSGGGAGGGSGGGYGIPPLPGGSGQPVPSGRSGGGFQIPGFPEVKGDGGSGGGAWGGTGGGGGSGGGAWGGTGGGQQPRGGSPLPLPGDAPAPSPGGNNPYGDIGDIIRGGGAGGGILATIIRSVFGSIIGRSAAPAGRGGGMIGWVVKMLVMRFGWRIVTGLFRGILRR